LAPFYLWEEGRWSLEKSEQCTEKRRFSPAILKSNLRAAPDRIAHAVATACHAFADAVMEMTVRGISLKMRQ
jgi:hypothetical protein